MRVIELRELLWAKGLIPQRWMVYYIKKREAVAILDNGGGFGEKAIAAVKQRQAIHMEKATAARKNRAKTFGITQLTPEEKMNRLVTDRPGLRYVETRACPDGFESATGYRRGKHAVVLVDTSGAEFLLTKGEAEVATKLGVKIPLLARRQTTSPKSINKTLKDIFG